MTKTTTGWEERFDEEFVDYEFGDYGDKVFIHWSPEGGAGTIKALKAFLAAELERQATDMIGWIESRRDYKYTHELCVKGLAKICNNLRSKYLTNTDD